MMIMHMLEFNTILTLDLILFYDNFSVWHHVLIFWRVTPQSFNLRSNTAVTKKNFSKNTNKFDRAKSI